MTRARDRAHRHRPQVPEARPCSSSYRVREPRARAEGRQAALRTRCSRGSTGEQRDRIAQTLELDPPRATTRTRRAGLLSHGQKQWLEIGMLLMQEPEAAAARRAGRRHDARGDRAHRRAVRLARRAAHGGRRRARHGVRAQIARNGHRAARRAACSPKARMDEVQSDPQVIEVYLGA